MKSKLFALVILILCTGCRRGIVPDSPDSVARQSQATVTFASPDLSGMDPTVVPAVTKRATSTSTATPSPMPTVTPSPTPTPTPTAKPIVRSGSPRRTSLSEPVPWAGVPCGVVDLLDFPLDPPDAENIAFGGQDFGVFRRRYDKYHAGEDWWGARRGSNFGMPVYSIGHGRVTYAAPLGWGRDQGVVIVRHTFADGGSILSFYGHLDPESVVLNAGDCVSRGAQVGRVGRPRTAPHLHFELRHHMPTEPGPGYWPGDPTLAGWEPPSKTIWGQRIGALPGVQWTRPFIDRSTRGVGLLQEHLFALIEERQLKVLDVADGTLRWQISDSDGVDAALVDPAGSTLFLADRAGQLKAFQILEFSENEELGSAEDVLALLWQLSLQNWGTPTLIPFPGGLIVVANRQLSAVSAEGRLLWEERLPSRLESWVITPDLLVFTTTGRPGSVWSIDETGQFRQGADISGQLIFSEGQLFIFGQTGIYRLDHETLAVELVYALPDRFLLSGDIVALPGGGLLVAHADLNDRRLIVLYADGWVRWDRSIADIRAAHLELQMLAGRPYLFTRTNHPSSSENSVYWVDIDNARLRLIFSGGTRNSIPGDNWVLGLDPDRFLINIGGGHMLAFEPRQAIEAVFRAMSGQ